MKKQELIEKLEERKTIIGNFQGYAVWWEDVKEIFEELLDEPSSGHAEEAPRYVKNILARLRELPLHDREVWLKAIMAEFEQDFSHAIWREGYKQGKFEGEWVGIQLKDADKIRQELNKPVIPQFVAKWIEYCKFTHVDLQNALLVGDVYFYNYANQKDFSKLKEFLETGNNQNLFARAWLDGYTVEKEKWYVVTDGNHLYFKKYQEDVEIVILADEMPGTMDYVKKFDTKEEAQEAANILGWKVEEVTE